MANTYLTRTPGSASNRTTWTWSAWIKRSAISTGSYQTLWNAGSSAADDIRLTITNNDQIIFGTDATTFFLTSQRIRDVSAWYHIVFAFDTTQGTASDRAKLYINGSLVTDFSTDNRSSLSGSYAYNNTVGHGIGRQAYSGSTYYDGYMAHVHFTDGTQYAASDFGQTDSTTGIWIPKTAPSVTYGTNGFFLKMENSGAMGTDSSGNGNTWSVSGGTLTQTKDTPSNVFATINALQKTSGSQLLSNGNLEHRTTGAWMYLPATIGASSAKWYAEVKLTDATNFNVGVMQLGGASDTTSLMNTNNTVLGGNSAGDAWVLFGNGADTGTYKNNTTPNFGNIATSFPSNIVVNDIVMIAMDTDNQKIWFGVNGSWDNSGDPAAGTNPMPVNTSMIAGKTYTFGSGPEQGTHQWNFGNGYFGTTAVSSGNADDAGIGIFEYAPPTGYYALCTKNIASYG